METRELILTVLVLYSSTVSLILAQNETTYLRELPTGQKLLCNRCPPGYRLQKHCTATHQTICKPCDAGLYTEVWNYIYECLPCRWCRPDQVEVQKCTNSTNRVCGCKEGFYLDSDICRPHSVCPSGYRVKEKGTPDRDTVCEHCQKGFHADGQLGNALCVPYSECKSEEKLLLHGTIYMDNVCVTCNRITCDVSALPVSFFRLGKIHHPALYCSLQESQYMQVIPLYWALNNFKVRLRIPVCCRSGLLFPAAGGVV
ncbi:tumor necrosis factor receptor superfamily member 11B-like isoform X2 [Hemibagrus wyckioides]|uniref:tumor necrosis factor receptor superfamily member 11B-like isoform X2 n=1 Tax=Hemibagrus wyckioides TaxID=337641 RepID=UPI00266CCCCD|nr:tumor necrosis factor receptor superfamily member 11B-like isoform X2 [Hemibagrus wyckioides]